MLQGRIVLTGLLQDVLERTVAGTAHPHFHQHLRDIGRFEIGLREQFQDAVVIGGDAVAGVEAADAVIPLAAHIEGRMRWHPAPAEFAPGIHARAPVPDHAGGVLLAHILQIAVHRRHRRIGESVRDTLQDQLIGIDVVGMKEADHLAGGAGNAFVQGVVDAFIRLADQAGLRAEAALQQGQGSVGTGAVHQHMFDVAVLLRGHGVEGVAERGGAVVGSGNDTYF